MHATLSTPIFYGPCDTCLRSEYLEKLNIAWVDHSCKYCERKTFDQDSAKQWRKECLIWREPDRGHAYLCSRCSLARRQKKKVRRSKSFFGKVKEFFGVILDPDTEAGDLPNT